MAANGSVAGGFPWAAVPIDNQGGLITRDWLYLIQLLYDRTGGTQGSGSGTIVSGSAFPPVFFFDGEDEDGVQIPGPMGPRGITGLIGPVGATGPAVFLEAPEADEPIVIPPRLSPGGWVDEKGSGGTFGFASGVDFTAGTTTVLTLSQPYGSQANLIVAFDGAWQGADQFSLAGKTLTFTSAIPAGTAKVFVKGYLQPN